MMLMMFPEQYTVSVSNRFRVLLREDEKEFSLNELRDVMKEAVLSSAKETIEVDTQAC